jgi:hypothetical protein
MKSEKGVSGYLRAAGAAKNRAYLELRLINKLLSNISNYLSKYFWLCKVIFSLFFID